MASSTPDPNPIRVALITRRFGGEHAATTNRLIAYVEALTSRGADVTVLTRFPFVHAGESEAPQHRGRWWLREHLAGALVIRARLPGEKIWRWFVDAVLLLGGHLGARRPIVGSDVVELLHGLLALPMLLRRRPHVVVVEQGPAWLAVPAAIWCGSKRTMVLQVSDVKSIAMQSPSYDNASAGRIKATVALESWLYGRARAVLTVTETMQRDIEGRSGVDRVRVHRVGNGAELEHFEPVNPRQVAQARAELGLGNAFVVAYGGYFGKIHDLGSLIGAAGRLSELGVRDIVFLLVGGGPLYREVRDEVARRGLENVKLVPSMPVDRLAKILTAADLGIATGVAGPGERIHAKIYSYMAAALPVLATDDGGETQHLLAKLGCGVTVEAGSAEALADAILRLKRDPRRRELGARGRSWVERFGSRRELALRFADVTLATTERSTAPQIETLATVRPAASASAEHSRS